MGIEFQNLMRDDGHTVITGQNFMVVKEGVKSEGVDDKGEPAERSVGAVTYLPKTRKCDVYYGVSAAVVTAKILANTPDLELIVSVAQELK